MTVRLSLERKVTYFQNVVNVIIAVGSYIPRASAEQARKNGLRRLSFEVRVSTVDRTPYQSKIIFIKHVLDDQSQDVDTGRQYCGSSHI